MIYCRNCITAALKSTLRPSAGSTPGDVVNSYYVLYFVTALMSHYISACSISFFCDGRGLLITSGYNDIQSFDARKAEFRCFNMLLTSV
jgi:hypothetical protein